MLKFYGFSRVNKMARGNTRDLRVLWALEELEMPFEIVGLDHPAGDLNTESYRGINPLEQIPAIDDGGTVVTESAAIVLYLAKKEGKLIPNDLRGEAQVIRWSFAAMNSVEMPLLSTIFIDFGGEATGDGKRIRDTFVEWSNTVLGRLNHWLEGREYIATESFTVADILMAHVLNGNDELFAKYPNVLAYRDRMRERPAWKRVIEAYCERVEPSDN
jgi:glutathione S-transferase